jgi:hypothetical protein
MLMAKTKFEDLVQIPPHGIREGYKITREDLEDRINEKYANKVCYRGQHLCYCRSDHEQVVLDVGLCIAMYDLLKTSDGHIGHDTGNVNVNGRQDWALPCSQRLTEAFKLNSEWWYSDRSRTKLSQGSFHVAIRKASTVS